MATNFVKRKGHLSLSDESYRKQLDEIKTKIESGQSLSSIADEYGTTIENIRQAKADLHIIDEIPIVSSGISNNDKRLKVKKK